MSKLLALVLVLSLFVGALAQTNSRMATPNPMNGYWPLEKSQPIIEKTQTVRLAPDLSKLSIGERTAVEKLLEVGKIFQRLYEVQRHAQALSALEDLSRKPNDPATQNLVALYRLFQGPIATTLDNKREPFLPVDPPPPGKNVYPWKVTKDEIENWLNTTQPKDERRAEILELRSVVRIATLKNLQDDIGKLRRYPALATLQPNLHQRLEALELTKRRRQPQSTATEEGFYVVPYALAYADDLMKAYKLLNEAADAVTKDDEDFSRYLRNRARDLLSNDYESGDASWVTGHFKNLNAQIGSYETYDDELYGVKTFFSLSLLLRREQETTALRQAMRGIQALEDSLPYQHHKKVREDIPVGVYDVVADFGQARGGNTATILPNESYLARRYGRTILLRANIMRDTSIFEGTSRTYAAAVGEEQAKALTSDGNFYRTLWHEVGHYLGVDRTKDGRDLDEALQDNSNTLEEMKADLVSLFVAEALRKQGYFTDEQLRSVYASGILRVLQNNRPRRDQPYNTMQLMQWNFYLENGLLSYDPATKTLRINYDKYHDVVGKMLAKTLEVQYQGDKAAADQFIDQYVKWDDNLHGVIAANIRAQQKYRYRLFKYAALGE
jgi:Zincin-like metallopeptidase